jgi:hypothetical protein
MIGKWECDLGKIDMLFPITMQKSRVWKRKAPFCIQPIPIITLITALIVKTPSCI